MTVKDQPIVQTPGQIAGQIPGQAPGALAEGARVPADPVASIYKDEALETMGEARRRWEAEAARSEARVPFWKRDWTTVSGMEVPPLVTPDEVAGIDVEKEIGVPGEFPYTRGIHPTG
jgi:hypothetical protein